MNESESSKCRSEYQKYCVGCGLDIASQGEPCVPWAWQLDLPPDKFAYYNSNHPPRGPIQLRGDARSLPVDSGSLDFVFSSHLLEDFTDWLPILMEWVRVLKRGGNLIILVPDKELWNKALANGQPPNDAHRHESYVGELTKYCDKLGLQPVEDRLTNMFPGDYTILFVAIKL